MVIWDPVGKKTVELVNDTIPLQLHSLLQLAVVELLEVEGMMQLRTNRCKSEGPVLQATTKTSR